MATLEIRLEAATDDASAALKARLARMMKWQSRTLTGLALLILLVLAQSVIRKFREGNAALGMPFALVYIGVLFATVVAGVILLYQVFQAGRLAFGYWSAFVYTGLTFILTFCLIWPGIFVIPHMIRLDVKRSLNVDLETEQAH